MPRLEFATVRHVGLPSLCVYPLQADLHELERSLDPSQVYYQQQTLCSTLAGVSCPLLTITGKPEGGQDSEGGLGIQYST